MYDVRSKYANPDKFIDRLTRRLKELAAGWDRSERNYRSQLGETIVHWDSYDAEQSVNHSCHLGTLHVNDMIRIDGVVTEVHEGPGNQSSFTYTVCRTAKTGGE